MADNTEAAFYRRIRELAVEKGYTWDEAVELTYDEVCNGVHNDDDIPVRSAIAVARAHIEAFNKVQHADLSPVGKARMTALLLNDMTRTMVLKHVEAAQNAPPTPPVIPPKQL